MPFIITAGRPKRRYTLTLRARTVTTQRYTLTLRASTAPGAYRVTLTLRAQTQPSPAQRYTLVLHARTDRRSGDAPSEVLMGRAPIRSRTRLLLDGQELPGVSWQHTRQAGAVEVEFTVRGAVRPARGAVMTVEVQQQLPGQPLRTITYESAPATGDAQITRGPDGLPRTIFSGRTTQDQELQVTALPELIAWVKSPSRVLESPTTRTVIRQVATVSATLRAAFQEAGQQIGGLNVLGGEYWEETRREFTTEGRSPADVFADTHGRVGVQLVLDRSDENRWLMIPPGQHDGLVHLRPELLTGVQEDVQTSQLPRRLTLQVGDLWTQVDEYLAQVVSSESLPDVVGENGQLQPLEIQDKAAALFEVSRDVMITGFADRDGRRTATLVRKKAGRVVESFEVTTVPVEVTQTVTPDEVLQAVRTYIRTSPYWQGELVTLAQRQVMHVLTSIIRTTYTYLPGTRDSQAVAETTTTHTAYSFTYTTVPKAVTGLPPELAALIPNAVQGDLLGYEATRVRNVWSPQGSWLRERLTVESRAGELVQQGLDDPATAPPPTALTVDEFSTTETYRPTGNGYWLYTRTRTGPQKLPVRDLDLGEIVKTERRYGVLEHVQETSENAPPTLRDEVPSVESQANGTAGTADEGRMPWPRTTYLRDPQVGTVVNPEGHAADVTAQLEVVREQDRAQSLAALLNRTYKPRTVRTVRTPEAQALRPGQRVGALGVIRQVTARGQGHAHVLEVETVEIHDH